MLHPTLTLIDLSINPVIRNAVTHLLEVSIFECAPQSVYGHYVFRVKDSGDDWQIGCDQCDYYHTSNRVRECRQAFIDHVEDKHYDMIQDYKDDDVIASASQRHYRPKRKKLSQKEIDRLDAAFHRSVKEAMAKLTPEQRASIA